MKRKMLVITALSLLLIAVLVMNGCGIFGKVETVRDESSEYADLKIGDTAPDFTAQLYDAGSFTLSDYKDKVVLVNFWATWCPPCVGELPAFEQLNKDGIDGFVMVAVDCRESKKDVDSFVKENAYTFNVAYDEDGSIEQKYPTDGIPYTLIIKNGVIENIFLGAPRDPYSEYRNAIDECLKK